MTNKEAKELREEVTNLRKELTSVQTALSLVLSPEHRKLIASKDVRKVFKEMIEELRREDECSRNAIFNQQIARQWQRNTGTTGTNTGLVQDIGNNLQRIGGKIQSKS